jgi:hypothetical protein
MPLNIEIVVYYIANKKLCVQELKTYHKLIPGFIEVVFHPDEKSMTVIDLHSARPGNSYATHLMVYACNEAVKRRISTITLDDCSDNYRKNRNIYTNVGMKYVNSEGGPEMIGNTKTISMYEPSTVSPMIYETIL